MAMELPPIVQRFIADTAQWSSGISKMTDALKGFTGNAAAQSLTTLRDKIVEVEAAATKQAVAARFVGTETAAAVKQAVADWERLKRAIEGPTAATRAQISAVRDLMSITQQATSGGMAASLARSMTYLPRAGSPQAEAQYRFANQSALEGLFSRSYLPPVQPAYSLANIVGGGMGGTVAGRARAMPFTIGGFTPDALAERSRAANEAFKVESRRLRGEVGAGDYAAAKTKADREMLAQRKRDQYDLMIGEKRQATSQEASDQLMGRYSRLKNYERMMRIVNAGGRVSRDPTGLGIEHAGGGGGNVFQDMMMGGAGGAGGGGGKTTLMSKLGTAYFLFGGMRQVMDSVKESIEIYGTTQVQAHKDLATASVTALHTAGTALLTGVQRGVGGFLDMVSRSLEGLLSGGDVKVQIAALGHAVGGVIGGASEIISGAVGAAGHMGGGIVAAVTRQLVGGAQMGGMAGQAIGGGMSMVGAGMIMSGVGTVPGLAVAGAGQLISAISGGVAGYLSAAHEAAGAIVGTAVSALTGTVQQLVGVATEGMNKVAQLAETIAGALMKAGMESEKFQATFRVLLGDSGRGSGMVESLRQLSMTTPYAVQNLSEAAQILLGMGVSADQVNVAMKKLGDMAAGDEGRLRRLAIVFGEVMAEGRLTGQRVRALATLGIGEADLARAAKLTPAEFRQHMRAGGVSSTVLMNAINQMTSPGGRMAGFSEGFLGTSAGQFQRLVNTAGVAAGRGGQAFNAAGGFGELFGMGADALSANMGKIVDVARTAGRYLGAMAREAVNVGIGFAGALPSIGNFFGFTSTALNMDWSRPTKLAEQLRDVFLSIVDAVGMATAKLVAFVGEMARGIPALLKNVGQGIMNIGADIQAQSGGIFDLLKDLKIGGVPVFSMGRINAMGKSVEGLGRGVFMAGRGLGRSDLFNNFTLDMMHAPENWAFFMDQWKRRMGNVGGGGHGFAGLLGVAGGAPGFVSGAGGILGDLFSPAAFASGHAGIDARRNDLMKQYHALGVHGPADPMEWAKWFDARKSLFAQAMGTFGTDRMLEHLSGAMGGGLDPQQTRGWAGIISGMMQMGMGRMAGGGLAPSPDQWRRSAQGRLDELRKLAKEGAVADRLVTAAPRGSAEAYEAFARTMAAGRGPRTVEDILAEGLEVEKQHRDIQDKEMKEIQGLRGDLRDKVFGPMPQGVVVGGI